MSYSHQVPYYFGQSWTGGFSNASVSRDAGTDATTSSGDLVDDAGGMILTPSGSTVSPANITEVQSTGSLTPTASPSDSRAPSVTNKTAPVPSADIENILKNEFNNLTIREKSRALASVRKSQYPDSGPGTEADIDTETAKSGDSSEEGGLQGDSKPVLADWQALCKAVGVTYDKVPDSITKCKETLKSCNVNLSDLATALRNGTIAQTFPSVAALSRYSTRAGEVAKKAVVKKDPLLKMMLGELFRGGKGNGK